MLRPCVFFDRDGVVNRAPTGRYVERLEDFHLLSEFVDALRVTHARGYAAVIVTNQRGVALGRLSEATLQAMHSSLRQALHTQGLDVLDIYSCLDADDSSPWRKPNPGMLLAAAEKHALDLGRSWMIGDHERDIEAGRRAGCRSVLVAPDPVDTRADYRLASMVELAKFLARSLAPDRMRTNPRGGLR